MSLIEIVCQTFTDEAAIFPMVHTNEKQSSGLPGKVTLFSAKYFCFNFAISMDVFWKRKKIILNYLQKFPIYRKLRSFLNHAESMLNYYLTKKNRQKVIIIVFHFRRLKITSLMLLLCHLKSNSFSLHTYCTPIILVLR